MEISAAALPFLILAAVLGTPALGYPVPEHWAHGVHRPTDCCFYYTARKIQCVFMESYYKTSSGCSLPAVIFKTKRGLEACAKPHSKRVQRCMEELDSAIPVTTVG